MSRFPFLTQIELAWKDVIQDDYDTHNVLSERTLQAALWAKLKGRAKNQFIFIEPHVYFPVDKSGKLRFVVPDIVICRAKLVIAFIELKFAPRGRPDVSEDIAKLLDIYEAKDSIELNLPRFLGIKAKQHTYRITDRTQFVLGCIGNREPGGLSSFLHIVESTKLKGRACVLLAETAENHACVVKYKRV